MIERIEILGCFEMCSLWRSMEESDDGNLEAVVRGYSRANSYTWQPAAAGIDPGLRFGDCNSLVFSNLMLSAAPAAAAAPAAMDLQDLCSAFYGSSTASGLLRSASSSSSALFESMEVQPASSSILASDSPPATTATASIKRSESEEKMMHSMEMSRSGSEPRDAVPVSKPLKVEPVKECDGASSTSLSQPIDSGVSSQPASKAQGSKRRKTQQKRIVCVPAAGGSNRPSGEGLPSDLWAWRKYGQKPIKGSPYPRGYYRCSSSKGCSARKQVERSRTDPTMLVITYTSDHNHPWPTHRNALAGSTRQNASSSEKNASKGDNSEAIITPENNNNGVNNGCAFSIAGAGSISSPELAPENLSSIIQEDHELSNMLRSDEDFFAELGELPDIFPRHFEEGKSDEEEAGSSVIDPFNLFNWSSPPSTKSSM